ncbi:hypothetical protein GCM10009804_47460 [Kribbella hippodromi]|uniref:Trypsin-like peptidase n=1 Tax=Kribbella hippodromi TaxID=434347 RepID=A0ABN2DSY2_9ACTN
MTEIDAHRVAEVIVKAAGGIERRGSGYLIRQGLVLTATHVIATAQSIRVRFDADRVPGEWSASGELVWSAGDVAVLAITPAGDPVPPARLGGIGDRAASLQVRAVGFPWFKLRAESDQTSYRDTHQADGTVATLSNRREGTLEVTVSPPAADPDPKRSPWDGMSGAALFAGDRIIGVLAEHHRSEGLGRLSAVRFDERVLTELADLLGVRPAMLEIHSPHERNQHARLLALSNTIAPDQLLDRTDELAELAAFCASDEPSHARDVEHEATNELVRVLRGPDRPVIGLLAASGGGLNKEDLAELTGRSRFDIAEQFAGALGRSVRLTEAGYVFSHDALRATAEEQLGGEVVQRRRELHAWAETYQHRHWPEGTPDYLLRTYPHLLAAVGDLDGLLWCAEDNERHDRLRAWTGADQLALSELFLAHRLNTMQQLPDLTVAMRLAVRRANLAARYAGMPACLPAVLELLGERTLAEALAYSMTDSRPRALVELAQVVADTDPDRAQSLVGQVRDNAERTAAMAWLADRAGDHRQASSFARTVDDYDVRASLCTDLAATAEAAADYARADEYTESMDLVPFTRSRILLARARAAAGRGDLYRAESLYRSNTTHVWPGDRGNVLVDLIGAARANGANGRVEELLAEARAIRDDVPPRLAAFLANSFENSSEAALLAEYGSGRCNQEVAEAFAAMGNYRRAEDHCRAEQHCQAHEKCQAEVYALVAKQAALAGNNQQASYFVDQCHRIMASAGGASPLDRVGPIDLILLTVAAGQLDRARSIVSSTSDPELRIVLRCALAHALARQHELSAATAVLQNVAPTLLSWMDSSRSPMNAKTAYEEAFPAALLTGDLELARRTFLAASPVLYSRAGPNLFASAAADHVEPIRSMIRELRTTTDRAAATVDFATTLLPHHPSTAAELAREVFTLLTGSQQDYDLHLILEAATCTPGDAHAMVEYVRSAVPAFKLPEFSSSLARALATAGDYPAADAALRSRSDDDEYLTEIYAQLALAAVHNRDLEQAQVYRDRAVTLLGRVPWDERRLYAYRIISEVTDKLGETAAADSYAASLRLPFGQALVFLHLADKGSDKQIRRRLAEALWIDLPADAIKRAVDLDPGCLNPLLSP